MKTKKPVKSTEKLVTVKIDNSPEAKAKRKAARLHARQNKTALAKKRRTWKRKLKASERMRIAERSVYTRAIRLGKSESEAKAAVLAYRKKALGAGNSSAKKRALSTEFIRNQYNLVNNNIKKAIDRSKDTYKKALDSAKKLKDPKARKAARAKASTSYTRTRISLVAKRKVALNKKSESIDRLKKESLKKKSKSIANKRLASNKKHDSTHRKVSISRKKAMDEKNRIEKQKKK